MEEKKNEKPEDFTPNPSIDLPSPKETELYDILDLQPDATTSQIKKSYFLKARKCHPDKNPDNPEAEEQFKQVSMAYEILSDPEKRLLYHKYGKSGIQDMGDFDPRAMFASLFGGGKFNCYIGEISLFNDNDNQTPEDFEATHKERVERLRQELIEKLKPWMEGNAKGFAQSIIDEAEELKKESYGAELLQHIGYIYENEAKQHLKGFLGIPGLAAEVKEKAHMVKEVFSAISQAAKIMMIEEQLDLAVTEEERRILEPVIQKQSIISMWKVARLDIEAAIRDACELVMKDPEIDRQSRRRRAEGIKTIGRVWKKIKPEAGKEGAWEFFAEIENQYDEYWKEEDANKWKNAFMPSKQKRLADKSFNN